MEHPRRYRDSGARTEGSEQTPRKSRNRRQHFRGKSGAVIWTSRSRQTACQTHADQMRMDFRAVPSTPSTLCPGLSHGEIPRDNFLVVIDCENRDPFFRSGDLDWKRAPTRPSSPSKASALPEVAGDDLKDDDDDDISSWHGKSSEDNLDNQLDLGLNIEYWDTDKYALRDMNIARSAERTGLPDDSDSLHRAGHR